MSIVEFQKIDLFLRRHYEQKKADNKSWSYAVWSRQLKPKDKAPLVRAVNGTRPISLSLKKSLAAYFKFKDIELDYFKVLAAYSRMKSQDDSIDIRVVLNHKVAALEQRVHKLPEEFTDMFLTPMSNWLRNMAYGTGLPVNHQKLMKLFRIDVDENEVFTVLDKMVQAGLFVKNKKGDRWELANTDVISTTSEEIGAKRASLKQIAYSDAAMAQLKKTLELTTPDRVRAFCVITKIHPDDMPKFSRAIHDRILETIGLFESAGPGLTFQVQMTGLRIAEDPEK